MKLHALSYQHNGRTWYITLEGGHEEIQAHAMHLGLTVEGGIEEQIPVSDADLQNITNRQKDSQ